MASRTTSTAANAARRILSTPPSTTTSKSSVRHMAALAQTVINIDGGVVSTQHDDHHFERGGTERRLRRNLSAATPSGATKNTSDSVSDDDYVSPYADFFDRIDKGLTSLGTDATKPYEPLEPIRYLKCGVRENDLRFTTTCYGRLMLPPYVMPDEHKVTLRVRLNKIPFESNVERDVFLQIVGKRYLPERNELRLISDQFASRIENKRHLTSMLDRIVLSARRLAKEAEEGKF